MIRGRRLDEFKRDSETRQSNLNARRAEFSYDAGRFDFKRDPQPVSLS